MNAPLIIGIIILLMISLFLYWRLGFHLFTRPAKPGELEREFCKDCGKRFYIADTWLPYQRHPITGQVLMEVRDYACANGWRGARPCRTHLDTRPTAEYLKLEQEIDSWYDRYIAPF